MYSTICVEWAADHFGLGLRYIDPLFTKICGKNDFTFSFPVTLTYDLDFIFAPLITVVTLCPQN